MRKIAQRTLTVTAVAATALALVAAPASAATPTDVDITLAGTATPTPPTTVSADVSGSSDGNVGGLNLDRPAALTCAATPGVRAALEAEGSVEVGLDQDATDVASLDTVDFNNPCTAIPGPVPTNVTAVDLPWGMDLTDVTDGSGVTRGKLTGVKIELDAPSIGCKVLITAPDGSGGYIEGTYTNPGAGNPGILDVLVGNSADPKNNLEVTEVIEGPCPQTLIQLGDRMTLSGKVEVSGSTGEGPVINAS